MKKKATQLIIYVFIVALLAWPFWYVVYSRYIVYIGLRLRPTTDFPITEVEYYLQYDPLWATDLIGDSNYTMASAGCLITAIAVAINNLGIQINPQELNERLREVEGYENGNLIWYKLNETIPSVDYRYSRVFTVKTIENDLKNGLLPIVNVRYHKYGITHWVLIVGAVDGEFIIYDPANTQLSYLPLSTHGKVYAYRVIVKSTDKALNPP